MEFFTDFFTFKELKGGVRAEPLYEVNQAKVTSQPSLVIFFYLFIFYEAFTAQIENSLNSLNSSLSLYVIIFVMVAAVSSDGGCSVFFSWWLQCVHLFLTARILLLFSL